MLFIPPPSATQEYYYQVIKRNFSRLGCKVKTLYPGNEISKSEARKKIRGSDIIYVGGGNTLAMMKRWRKLGIDKLLIKAYKRGAVLCGLSAGSICWFRYGISDSRKFSNPQAPFIRVRGLGLLGALHAPHYDNNKGKNRGRKKNFKEILRKKGGIGIAIDECCALEIVDEGYRIITSKPKRNAYKAYWKKGKYHHEKIKKTKEFLPVEHLFKK